VSSHDEAVLSGLRELTSGDTLWVLGDLIANANHLSAALDDLAGLECSDLRFISGNHDPVWPGHRESHKWTFKYLEVFRLVTPFARVKLAGEQVLLSHFPYQGAGDHTPDERYTQYRLPDLGGVLVHGHTHSARSVSWGPGGGLQVNVCWEAWKRPVGADELLGVMAGARARAEGLA